LKRYVRFLTERCLKPARPALIVTHGPSGAGKTTLTQHLLEQIDAVRMRTDVERKRLFGFAPDESTPEERREEIYGPAASRAVYSRLHDLARVLLEAGETVILDGTYLTREHREAARAAARGARAACLVIDFQADADTLADRVRARTGDASEAGLAVLRSQLVRLEPIAEDERGDVLSINTVKEAVANMLRREVCKRLG